MTYKMANKIEKLDNLESKSLHSNGNSVENKSVDLVDVKLDFLDDSGDAMTTGEVSENENSTKNKAGSVGMGGKHAAQTKQVRVSQPPTVEVMVKQVESAVLLELQKCYEEEKSIKRNPNYKPQDLNSVVIKIRKLNGIMASLKEYWRLAGEMIANLWNTYVKKN